MATGLEPISQGAAQNGGAPAVNMDSRPQIARITIERYLLKTKVGLLEDILREKGINAQAELESKGFGPSFSASL